MKLLPNPQSVPYITAGVLVLAVAASAALLFGLPAEDVLSITDNPASRVAVVSFALALVGAVSLSIAIYTLLFRHRRFEQELAEMRELVKVERARTEALAASADGLEARTTAALEQLEADMADERERMRAQARAYLGGSATRRAPPSPTQPARPAPEREVKK